MKFERQKMVRWFSVPQLAATGLKALVSTLFGNYADKRETQASLYADGFSDYSKKNEIWIDFISDLGDGFNSTYTMASLLAKDELIIKEDTNTSSFVIPRGNILVMGGDQVYPTPGNKEYLDRLQGPYNSAFPWDEKDAGRPHLFAIPGNHDWYDGLSSFLKLFCQNRALGNWHTQQKRSYFAIKLPHDLWLWGIDVQLHADIDYPQLLYFEKIASQFMSKGSRVILCTAEPAWVYEAISNNYISYDRFNFFVDQFFDKKGHSLVAVLTGDLHHYSRYEELISPDSIRHYITAGGGGAFLHSTHDLPEIIEGRRNLKLKSTFPDKVSSRNLLFGNLFFPFKNYSMPLLVAAIHLIALWFLQSKAYYHNASFLDTIATSCFSGLFTQFFNNLSHNPAVVLLNLLILSGMLAFTDTAGGKYKGYYIAGIIHGLLHILTFYLLIWGFSIFNLQVLDLPVQSLFVVLLYVIEMLLIGTMIIGFLFGLYLIVCNLFIGSQGSEAYSALRFTGFKNFLRMHVSSTGITIYAVGVRRVVKNWQNTGTEEDPKFSGGEIKYELIEKPVVIKPEKLT